jgi:hypothetical protein
LADFEFADFDVRDADVRDADVLAAGLRAAAGFDAFALRVVPATWAATFLAPSLRKSTTSGAFSFAKSSAFLTWCCTLGSCHRLPATRLMSS